MQKPLSEPTNNSNRNAFTPYEQIGDMTVEVSIVGSSQNAFQVQLTIGSDRPFFLPKGDATVTWHSRPIVGACVSVTIARWKALLHRQLVGDANFEIAKSLRKAVSHAG